MSHQSPPDFTLDTAEVRRSFERASAGYDRAAVLQTNVRRMLFERLDYAKLDPQLILDAGCGTGHASRRLKKKFRKSRVFALDLSIGMLKAAARQQGWLARFSRVCADASRLPLADNSVDLIYSNLMLQWCNDLDAVFAEFRRVLKPHGLLSFSTFGPDTLKELRTSWAAADDRTHVNRFIDMHDIGDALTRAGLAEPVLDVEYFTLTYDDTSSLMHDLKAIGAHNINSGRAHGLTGRGRLVAMSAAYEQHRKNDKLPATYEVVFGQAWGRPAMSAAKSRGGEAVVPIAEIGRRP